MAPSPRHSFIMHSIVIEPSSPMLEAERVRKEGAAAEEDDEREAEDDVEEQQQRDSSRRVASFGPTSSNNKEGSFVPIALKFLNVRYSVQLAGVGGRTACWSPLHRPRDVQVIQKEILHGVSGYVVPGEILAMMGPSGSGKTTLLNILGGRTRAQVHLTGSISYNDMAYSKSLKRRMGFVTQDDVLFMHLTVEEVLRFAALLRLPGELTRQQKIDRADSVVRELGLEKCRHTIIGGPFHRGISGGERKRVCIGQEILIDPSIIFLDEPTSGLDSTIALRILQLVRSLARAGRTIVTTIHQPSSRLYHMFDKLMLLSEGHPIYFGKGSEAMQYFSSLGFNSTLLMNPADFFLDLANGNVHDTTVPHELEARFRCLEGAQGLTRENVVQQYLAECFKSHSAANNEILVPAGAEVKLSAVPDKRGWVISWWEQFCVLTSRGFRERRHEHLSFLRVFQIFLSAVIAGLIWWQSKIDNDKHLQDQTGLAFFISVYWGYYPIFLAIYTFPQERAILVKERASDMYRLSSYFMSRTLGDLPLNLILPFMFLCIVYFMAHMRLTFGAFILTLLALFLIVVAAEGLGLFVGAAMMDTKHATTLASIVLLIFMLTGGFFTHNLPVFISWLKYISYTNYAYKLLLKVQFSRDSVYDCSSGGSCKSVSTSPSFHGVDLRHPYIEVIALLIMAIGYRFLAYLALRRSSTT